MDDQRLADNGIGPPVARAQEGDAKEHCAHSEQPERVPEAGAGCGADAETAAEHVRRTERESTVHKPDQSQGDACPVAYSVAMS
jgi:hypothetical protein